jgi:hypothetical protein
MANSRVDFKGLSVLNDLTQIQYVNTVLCSEFDRTIFRRLPYWSTFMSLDTAEMVLNMELRMRTYLPRGPVPSTLTTEYMEGFLWPALETFMKRLIDYIGNLSGHTKYLALRKLFKYIAHFAPVIRAMASTAQLHSMIEKCIECCNVGYTHGIVTLKALHPLLVTRDCYPIIDHNALRYNEDLEYVENDAILNAEWQYIQMEIDGNNTLCNT